MNFWEQLTWVKSTVMVWEQKEEKVLRPHEQDLSMQIFCFTV